MRARLAVAVVGFVALAALRAQVDWQCVQSPVKDQGGRGTCCAFAVLAALEAQPGIPGNLSEQFAYALIKLMENDLNGLQKLTGTDSKLNEGSTLHGYASFLQYIGVPHERWLPYDPSPRAVGPETPAELKELVGFAQLQPAQIEAVKDRFGKYMLGDDTEYLEARDAQDVGRIKGLLDQGCCAIPACYQLHEPTIQALAEQQKQLPLDRRQLVFAPEMMNAKFKQATAATWLSLEEARQDASARGKEFDAEWREGVWEKGLATEELANKHYNGHAMTIVGYDADGFLVKNSWGTEAFGRGGYARVAFDYHLLFCTQAVIVRSAKTRMPSLDPFELSKRLRESDYRLKVQPFATGARPRWVVSVCTTDDRDPMLGIVEYRVQGQQLDGSWHELERFRVRPPGDTALVCRKPGFPLELEKQLRLWTLSHQRLRFVVRFGHFPNGGDDDPERAVYPAEKTFPEFAPELAGTIELAPK